MSQEKQVNPFDLEDLYKNYLRLVQLEESKMPAVQNQETKRAFMGGVCSILLITLEELNKLEDQLGAITLKSMMDKSMSYWINERNKVVNEEKNG